MKFTKDNIKYMNLAFKLAELGKQTAPNPKVGAVLVKRGKIIGKGYHDIFGGPHAEVNAVNSSKESVAGATMYVTLEPCSHFGKTPPCANMIVDNKIKEVFISVLDEHSKVNGKGIKILQDSGVKVHVGLLEDKGKAYYKDFFFFLKNNRPLITLKIAATLDGKVATENGDSKWITNEKSRKYVHSLRSESKGILVGINTIEKDNPELNVRDVKGKDPIKFIVDPEFKISSKRKIFNSSKEETFIIIKKENFRERKLNCNIIMISGKFNVKAIIKEISKLNIFSLFVEGGPTTITEFINGNNFDTLHYMVSPKFIGTTGKDSVGDLNVKTMRSIKEYNLVNIKRFDNDFCYTFSREK